MDVAAATASVTAPPTMRLRETSGKDWVKSAEGGVSVILQSLEASRQVLRPSRVR
jgi:hypothetical protein